MRKKGYDFDVQVAARYDRVKNGLECLGMIDLVQELNPHLYCPDASRQVLGHIIPKAKQEGYIKGFVTHQSTTTDRYDITVKQNIWWHTLAEEQYKRLRLNNDGGLPVYGKSFGEIMPYFIFGFDEESICVNHHGNVKINGSEKKA